MCLLLNPKTSILFHNTDVCLVFHNSISSHTVAAFHLFVPYRLAQTIHLDLGPELLSWLVAFLRGNL